MDIEPNYDLADSDKLVGSTFADKYELDSVIRNGSNYRIYEAKRSGGSKPIAIKLLHRDQVAEAVNTSSRFMQEVNVTKSLSHPGIVTVIDFGASRDGHIYLALELLAGKTLKEQLAESGPLSAKTAANVFRRLCKALAHCHSKGVFHLGLSPTDIILLPAQTGTSEFTAKIIDFGNAVVLKEGDRPVSVPANSGCPLYMSPEQRAGKIVDARSDIYSLGAVMYEALSGRPPFTGKDIEEINRAAMFKPPPPLSEENRDSSIPAYVEAAVFKAMAKNPSDRFENMLDMSNALSEKENSQSNGILSQIGKLFKR